MTSVPRSWTQATRLGGLRRFAFAITTLNVLGHTIFGFEQPWATPFVAVAVAYAMECLLEMIDARLLRRPVRFLGGGPVRAIDFLLPAHISGLAVGMLLYANDRLWPVAFASAVAIASKAMFRVRTANGSVHFLNPSNCGITLTLLLIPWVGIAPPYQFTEGLGGIGDWALPGLIVISGSFLNWRFTQRLPLVAAWACGFVAQALIRYWLFDARLDAALAPMTGTAFILFSFYMVSDPATTPSQRVEQILFGASTALVYGLLMMAHIVFGLFFALSLVCCGRGLAMAVASRAVRVRRAAGHAIEDAIVAAVPSR